jgi:hypothetical protein
MSRPETQKRAPRIPLSDAHHPYLLLTIHDIASLVTFRPISRAQKSKPQPITTTSLLQTPAFIRPSRPRGNIMRT